MKKSLAIFYIVTGSFLSTQGQTVIVTDEDSYTTPARGAVLDIQSPTKGVVIPRMTTAERNTLGATVPTEGVVVYDSEINSFFYWHTDEWHQMLSDDMTVTNYRFGDAENYAEFEANGTLVLYGSARVFDDIMVPGFTVRSGSTAPAFEPFVGGVYITYFLDAGASSEDHVYFSVQFPHSWAGTTIYPHVHWSPETDPGTDAVVRWGLEYTWVEYNAASPNTFPATTTVYADAPCKAGSQKKHLLAPFGPITPTADQDGISSMMMCKLFRNSSHANDTYNGKRAGFLQFDIHFEKNTEGSRTLYTK